MQTLVIVAFPNHAALSAIKLSYICTFQIALNIHQHNVLQSCYDSTSALCALNQSCKTWKIVTCFSQEAAFFSHHNFGMAILAIGFIVGAILDLYMAKLWQPMDQHLGQMATFANGSHWHPWTCAKRSGTSGTCPIGSVDGPRSKMDNLGHSTGWPRSANMAGHGTSWAGWSWVGSWPFWCQSFGPSSWPWSWSPSWSSWPSWPS